MATNLEGQGFHTNPERINKAGRPVGSKSRSTLFREWLDVVVEGESNQTRIMKALMKKAGEGDVSAIRESLDSAFGKVPDKVVEIPADPQDTDLTHAVLRNMTAEQIEAALAAKSKDNGS